jgi:soluble P-type ATPase
MLEIAIPGFKDLRLMHLVLDYNGTMALDGASLDGLQERVEVLARSLEVHVLTADTFGTVAAALADWPCNVAVLKRRPEDQAKLDYLEKLKFGTTCYVGNGRNDRLAIKDASLGVAVVQAEGACVQTLLAADVVVPSVLDALDLLLEPRRLQATLRL